MRTSDWSSDVCSSDLDEAGVTLRDEPSPLYQLLVLTTLSATRISAEIAVAAARELFAAGWRTPEKMREATWQQDRKNVVSGKSVSVRVGFGGRRIYKKKKITKRTKHT